MDLCKSYHRHQRIEWRNRFWCECEDTKQIIHVSLHAAWIFYSLCALECWTRCGYVLIDHSMMLPSTKYSVTMRCWYDTVVKSNGSTRRSKLQNRLYGQSIGLSPHSEYWRVIARAHPNIRFNVDMGEDKQRSYWMMKRGTRQTYAPEIPL